MSKKESIVSFLKRNAFYLILAVVLTVIAVVGAVVIVNQNKSTPTFKKNSASVSTSTSLVSNSSQIQTSQSSNSGTNTSNSSQQRPTVITFIMPVEGGVITKEYTDNTVVFNPTLGVYSAHLAVDITGAEGASVLCAYAGTVESIESTYLQGTIVTVNHGDGLKTVYSSLEVDEALQVGQTLEAGDILGVISTTNRQEYKEGAHLHFETLKNGAKVDPTDYLIMDEDK